MHIPFNLNIKYWLLNKNSKEYKIAKLSHLKKNNKIDDYSFELELLNLDFIVPSEKKLPNYSLRLNELDFKYNKIDEYVFNVRNITVLETDEIEFNKKKLELDFKYNKIKEIDYLKNKATYNNEPFVAVKPNFEETDGDELYLEIECNDIFLDKIKKQGYSGDSKEELIDQWLKYKMVNSFDNLNEIINNEIPTVINKIDIDNTSKKIYT